MVTSGNFTGTWTAAWWLDESTGERKPPEDTKLNGAWNGKKVGAPSFDIRTDDSDIDFIIEVVFYVN